jgi:hypothetical protein
MDQTTAAAPPGAAVKPTVSSPLPIHGIEYGGARPLFCIPLVPVDLEVARVLRDIVREPW